MPDTLKSRRPGGRTKRAAPAAPVAPATPGLPLGVRRQGASDGLALPHERDESHQTTAVEPDPVIVQAKRDLDAGLVDTDMRATPGLDAERRARMVPGPGGKPPR